MGNPAEEVTVFLKQENILCGLEAETCAEAIALLARHVHKNEGGFECDAVIEACIERERAVSTVIAPGLGIPHARVAGLPGLMVAVATSPRGVYFCDRERGKVHVIVLILTPLDKPALHLQALSALTRHLGDKSAISRLASAAKADEVFAFFSEREISLPPFLKAHNVMDHKGPTVLETDTLDTAIRTLCTKRVLDLPVVDEEGDLRGTIALEDILNMCLPEHLLWMNDLTPIIHFEPFAEILRRERHSKVADLMRENCVTVAPSVPAMQLAKLFLTEGARQILIVEDRSLLGTVDLNSFMTKLMWT